jgi:hypothetical protein
MVAALTKNGDLSKGKNSQQNGRSFHNALPSALRRVKCPVRSQFGAFAGHRWPRAEENWH